MDYLIPFRVVPILFLNPSWGPYAFPCLLVSIPKPLFVDLFAAILLRHSSWPPLRTLALLFISACGLAFIPIFVDYDGQYIQTDLTLQWSYVSYMYMRLPKTEVGMHFQLPVRCLLAGLGGLRSLFKGLAYYCHVPLICAFQFAIGSCSTLESKDW